jgi:cytochrome P450
MSAAVSSRAFPTGPRAAYPGQFLLQLRKDPIKFITELTARSGPVVGFSLAKYRVVVLAEPELIHRVLVTDAASYVKGRGLEVAKRMLGDGLLTSEGELHRQQRQLLQPVFQARKVELFGPVVESWSRKVIQDWPENGSISASKEMTRLTLQIVGESLFGTNLENDVNEVRSAMDETLSNFRTATLPFYSLGEKLFPSLRRKFEHNRGRLDAVVMRMIAEHREHPKQDLLGRMVEACREAKIDDQLLRDEAMTLFLAGHETTAHALTFALYLLSRHPAEQIRIQEELAQVVGSRAIQPDDLDQLPLLKDVLLETLRLFPPGWIIGRRSIRETTVGQYTLPAGCTVLMSPYVMHRQEAFFPNAERFWPDRWIERPRTSLPKYCYFPFGAGPRVCIGEHFAWMEMLVGLGTILQNYQLGFCQVDKPRLEPGITLAPAEELMIPVQRRTI